MNTDEAMEYVNGNVALYCKMLNLYREKQRDAVARIGEALLSGEHDSAVRMSHTLRGLAASIGASDLVRKLRDLEADLRNGQYELASAWLKEVDRAHHCLLDEIDRAMPREEGEANKVLG